MVRSFLSVLVFSLVLLAPGTLAAQVSISTGKLQPLGREQALDTLFAELAKAESQIQAQAIQKDIWEIWTYSGSPSIDLLMERSIEAMNSGEFEHALKLLNEMVRLAPTFPEAWNKRATVNYYLGDNTRSLADIAQTLSREPRHFGALSGLAMIFESQGDFINAAIARSRIQSLMPLVGRESPRATEEEKTEEGTGEKTGE
ncbi:MAG: hypothetical protein OXF09_07185 [Hyphomicrobiales bacterium]|nr:hypothetical protein [Hyphomicrobiales bacterium]